MQSGELANIMIALRKAEDHVMAAQKNVNKMLKSGAKPVQMSNTLTTLQVAKVELDKAIEIMEQAISPRQPLTPLNPSIDDDDVYEGDEYGSYDDEDDRYDKWR